MFASIRRYAGDTALADRLVEHEDEVRALISGVPGFRAYYLVRGDDATASITICDDRAGVDESNKVAAGWLRENLPEAAGAPPQVTAGDVVIHGVLASARS
jgi:hypothetical protein